MEERNTIDKLEMRKLYVGEVIISPMKIFSLSTRVLGWAGLLVLARRVLKVSNKWRNLVSSHALRQRENRSIMTSSLETKEKCINFWYRYAQQECFRDEIRALETGKSIHKNSRTVALKAIIDNMGILRTSGRIKSTFPGEFNNQPIILEGKHFLTTEIIKEFHRRFYHGSNNTVLNELRQTYQIVGLRGALRTLTSRCIVCRIQRAKPFNPTMANLPIGRTAYRLRSFTHCGLDYYGPLQVKIGRRREKRWGALFTCLTTRAVHLELAHTLSADSAIMALQRLAARRGTPIHLYSDNGTNFHGAEKELREALKTIDNKKIGAYAKNKNINWHFNPASAPFMGGAWERLVRSVKTALYIILKEQAPKEEVLITVLAEIEYSINSRPLTYVSLDPRDGEALTPNHFLIGTSSGEVNLGRSDNADKCPKKQLKLAQSYADAFWKRWLREYLPSLIPRQKWTDDDDPIKIDDIVLIVDLQIVLTFVHFVIIMMFNMVTILR